MSIDIDRAEAEGRRNRPPRTVDRVKALEVELRQYPSKGLATPHVRMWAGLNLSHWFEGDDLRELQKALGVPLVVSKTSPLRGD